jgi:hypothetical protein
MLQTVQRKARSKEAHYQPEVLFPSASNFKTELEMRSFLKKELIRMAEEKTLFVTDLMSQPNDIGDACGMIILGQVYRDQKMDSEPVPQELANYMVRIRPLNKEKTVEWKVGRESVGASTTRGGAQIERFEDAYHYVEADAEGFVTLPLPQAWIALRQYGANCRKCRRVAARADVWRFEEVRPEPSNAPLNGPRRKVRDGQN